MIDEKNNKALVVNKAMAPEPYTYVIEKAAEQGKKLGAVQPLYNILGRFYESKDGKPLWSYFSYATDARGIQLLDPVFLDKNSFINQYRVLRKEILGDRGKDKPYDAHTALSDHAHVLVTITAKK